MKKVNNAFTLTELLVALGVIAVLCAVLLPVVFNLMPNQNTIMAKRAYYTLQTVISDMLNDESCYPDRTNAIDRARVGLDDGLGYVNCKPWDNVDATENAQTKFIYVFKDKLGILDTTNNPATTTFETNDGISWAFSNFAFDPNDAAGGSMKITIDVNGKENKSFPNCGHKGVSYVGELGTGDDSSCANRENGFDRFQVTVKGNGQVTINSADVWAVNAVKVNRNITSDKNSNDEDD